MSSVAMGDTVRAPEDQTQASLLVVELQRALREKENELQSVKARGTAPLEDERRTQDLIRLQELELENEKLRDDLAHLRGAAHIDTEILKQYENLEKELSRKKEESIQLRTVLASNFEKKSFLKKEDEDEIGLILQTQKTVIQQLERELQVEKVGKAREVKDYRHRIEALKGELSELMESKGEGISPRESRLNHQVLNLTKENLVRGLR